MFCIRPRRYYKKDVYEIWSMEHNNGEGFIAEDVLVIKFEENYIKALLIVKEATRSDIDEYNSYVYGKWKMRQLSITYGIGMQREFII